MLTAAARRRVAALRQPGPAVRIARALWIAWAIVVWNVVFDRVVVVAGRSYIGAASRAAAAGVSASPLDMDDWMQPAVTRGLFFATAAASAILVPGLAALRVAARRQPGRYQAPVPHRGA
jgi:CubicO group peptidase (beta-lactamase class C family)